MALEIVVEEYNNKMKNIEERILEITINDDLDEKFLNKKIQELYMLNIQSDKYIFKDTLRLISKISKHHYRNKNFFNGIEQIIHQYKNDMQLYFSNDSIFDIFKGNKRILQFLLKDKIITPNESILKIITNDKYSKMFYPEYFSQEFNIKNHNDVDIDVELFELKRKIGENDSYICELIRNDSVIDFIKYINKKDISLSSKITSSIFETNPMILKQNPTLIQYSAFCGSIQIFRYITMNDVELQPSLWIYAIHSNNPEIIHFLEDLRVIPNDPTYKQCYKEAIKCHHNEMMNYFYEKFFHKDDLEIVLQKHRYYNHNNLIYDNDDISYINENCIYFNLLKNEVYRLKYYYKYNNIFFDLIKYDCTSAVDLLLKHNIIDPNRRKYGNTDSNKTALIYAVKTKRHDIAEILLKQSTIDANNYYIKNIYNGIIKWSAIHIAIENKDLLMVKVLLSCYKTNINKKLIIKQGNNKIIEKSPLSLAIEKDDYEIVKYILSNQNLNINLIITKTSFTKVDKTALYIALKKGNIEIISLLLSCKDINIKINCIEYVDQYEYCSYKKKGKMPKKSKKIKKKIIKEKTIFDVANKTGNNNIIALLSQFK